MSGVARDVATHGAPAFAETRLGKGWEPAVLTTLTILLVGVGLVTVYSVSGFLAQREGLPDTYYVLRQTAGAAAGLVLMVAATRVPYHWFRALAWPSVFVTAVLLLMLVLPWTRGLTLEENGARRWLDLGITVQPSELAKLAIVVWTAHVAVRKAEHFRSFTRGFLPFLLVWGVLVLPIMVEGLSSAFVAGMTGAVILFAAGARLAHFAFLGLLLSPVAVVQLGEGFRQDRLLAFRDLETFAEGAGYQVTQSLIAIGSGGITGVGFGEGRQKFGFLPEPHNDFIFSMIAEEWGLFGVTFIVGLYLALVLVGFRVAARAPDAFGQLLAIGITSLIALQATLHVGVGLGVVPPTGISLPLVSYGRWNLLVTLVGIGILGSVARADRSDVPSPAGRWR